MPAIPRIKPGIGINDAGDLCFFTIKGVAVLIHYPILRGFYRPHGEAWRGCRLYLPAPYLRLSPPKNQNLQEQLVLPAMRDHNWRLIHRRWKDAAAAWRFSEPIPLDLRKIVRAFGNNSLFEILQALSPNGVPYARQMFESCPALLFLIVNCDKFLATPPSRRLFVARRLIQRPQEEIVELMGFPGQSAVTVLRRIKPRDLSLTRLGALREVLRQRPFLETLRHARNISGVLIDFFAKGYARWLCERFLRQLCCDSKSQAEAYYDVEVIADICASLPQERRNLLPPLAKDSITGWKYLTEFRSCAEHLRRHCEHMFFDQPLPPPPIPGRPGIHAITHGVGLVEESDQMHNCVASLCYLRRIFAGEYYVYRLAGPDAPERATVGIRKQGLTWKLDQISGLFNLPVSAETFDWVTAWFAKRDPSELADDPGEPFYEAFCHGSALRDDPF